MCNYKINSIYIPNCTGQLTIRDLRTVRKAVWEAHQRWFDIGLKLDLSMSDLNAIKASHCNSVELCFSEMLTIWLKQVDPAPTWSALVGALQLPTVGYEELAKRVESEVTELGPATEVQVGEFIG